MVIIYSNEVVKDLNGVYVAPFRFDGIEKRAKRIYTNDKKIADAYNGKCEVLALPKAKIVKKVIQDEKD